jgi:proteic killer suppression protein
MAIVSFKSRQTEQFFEGMTVARFEPFRRVAERKLQLLDSAKSLAFLRSPPGNRLERLEGDRSGQHSIRINAQYRLCFVWTSAGPKDVEIVDYH